MKHNQLSKDISSNAIKKAVINTTLQKPFTIYPAAIGILGGFYILLFGVNIIGLSALIGGGSIAIFNWVYEYFIKGHRHAVEFIRLYRKQLEKRRVEALSELETELKGIKNDQAFNQVKLFRNKYDNFHTILERKLDSSEITYNRYLTIAEQVFLNGLDNLENAALSLKSISTISSERIKSNISELQKNNNEHAEVQINELQMRLDLRNQQLERVGDLLTTNEKALTQLDQVATKIANIDTKQNRAQVDMEDAMEELNRLISRAEQYSN